jgi:peptide/nickel transport system permease protein
MTVAATAEEQSPPAGTPARRRNRYLVGLGTGRGITGLTLIAVIVLAGLIVPLLLSSGPLEQTADALAQPSGAHPLGTDEVGRDILARVVGGIRVDLLLALVAVPTAAVAGTGLGMLGAVGGLAGGAVQRLFDVLLGFPGVVLGVAVGIALGPGFGAVLVTIVLFALPAFGRQARMATLGQMSRDYVSAARVLGTSRTRVLIGHMLPNIADAVLVRAAVGVAQAIQIEGGLSVVGLGIQPPRPSLGSMIAGGSQYLSSSPLYSLVPVLVVFVLIFGCTLVADALNKAVLRR